MFSKKSSGQLVNIASSNSLSVLISGYVIFDFSISKSDSFILVCFLVLFILHLLRQKTEEMKEEEDEGEQGEGGKRRRRRGRKGRTAMRMIKKKQLKNPILMFEDILLFL